MCGLGIAQVRRWRGSHPFSSNPVPSTTKKMPVQCTGDELVTSIHCVSRRPLKAPLRRAYPARAGTHQAMTVLAYRTSARVAARPPTAQGLKAIVACVIRACELLRDVQRFGRSPPPVLGGL